MINFYLKTIKLANYFIPMIPSNHRYPCFHTVDRQTIKVNFHESILGSYYQPLEDRKHKAQRKH